MDPQTWLNENKPEITSIIDGKWVFEQYNYPEEVRKYIKTTWIKKCKNNICNYYKPIKEEDENKKAIDILKNQGLDAAANFMFTNPETKKPMSYSDMRSRFG